MAPVSLLWVSLPRVLQEQRKPEHAGLPLFRWFVEYLPRWVSSTLGRSVVARWSMHSTPHLILTLKRELSSRQLQIHEWTVTVPENISSLFRQGRPSFPLWRNLKETLCITSRRSDLWLRNMEYVKLSPLLDGTHHFVSAIAAGTSEVLLAGNAPKPTNNRDGS